MAAEQPFSVLVVDDEPSVLVTYRLILQQEGYDVTAAGTSTDALQALEARPYDLLLCDLSLEQKQSGFDVIATARVRYPAMRCALLTGYASKEIGDRALQNGIAVLFKPIDIEEFLQTIAKLAKEKYDEAKTSGR